MTKHTKLKCITANTQMSYSKISVKYETNLIEAIKFTLWRFAIWRWDSWIFLIRSAKFSLSLSITSNSPVWELNFRGSGKVWNCQNFFKV